MRRKAILGRIVKGVGGQYSVLAGQTVHICKIRGSIKQSDKICVGDIVEFDEAESVIKKIQSRKNFLLRPSVSNVDQVLFLIAPSPKPDLVLLDKILIKCLMEGVPLYLCLNKQDLAGGTFSDSIRSQYSGVAQDILVFSAKTGEGVEAVRNLLPGRLSCLSGQSAVGKSSLMNALFPDLDAETGGLSAKTERGRHTTRHSEIFLRGDILICDTPGFSSFQLEGVDAEHLNEYYVDLFEHSDRCKYRGCTHIHEPDCEVKRLVSEGKVSAERYERYKSIYEELKTRRKNYE